MGFVNRNESVCLVMKKNDTSYLHIYVFVTSHLLVLNYCKHNESYYNSQRLNSRYNSMGDMPWHRRIISTETTFSHTYYIFRLY